VGSLAVLSAEWRALSWRRSPYEDARRQPIEALRHLPRVLRLHMAVEAAVMEMFLCRSRRLTVSRSTPSSSASVAQLCRSTYIGNRGSKCPPRHRSTTRLRGLGPSLRDHPCRHPRFP
jgi:hypothetical protein